MIDLPQIALDARPLSHPQNGGFRAYVRSLVRGFTEREVAGVQDIRLLLYLDRPLPAEIQASLPRNAETRILSNSRLKSDFLHFARQVKRDRPDLVHGTVNYLPFGLIVPATLTLHDAMGIKSYPWAAQVPRTLRQKLMNAYWGAMTRLSARQAKHIITVSFGAAEELIEALKLPRERFTVVYNGITLPFSRPGDLPRQENVVLAIASPDLRKNLDVLYRALSEQRERFKNVPLLHVVCTDARAAERAEAMLKAREVMNYRLLCNLDDVALANAYASTAIFVWPSRLEGFGMPPLEAMQAGCPVVSSAAPVMPEVLGDIPRYFDPERPDQLATELNALLEDRSEQAERGEQGRAYARQFTCRRMADETAAVWLRILAGRVS